MLSRNRFLTVLTAASYLLVVSGSSLFHDHSDDCSHDDHSRPGVSASHFADGHECPICQFLAQKTAPVEVVTPVHSTALVQHVALSSPLHVLSEAFSAWHSRAPPAFA
jgi:hypothetical protein